METFSLPDFMSSVWDNVYPVGAFKVVMTDEFHRSASLASPDRGWDLSFVPPPPTSSSPSSEDMHNAPADNPAHTAMVAAPMRQIANGSKGSFVRRRRRHRQRVLFSFFFIIIIIIVFLSFVLFAERHLLDDQPHRVSWFFGDNRFRL